jgi:hypothetical protein
MDVKQLLESHLLEAKQYLNDPTELDKSYYDGLIAGINIALTKLEREGK